MFKDDLKNFAVTCDSAAVTLPRHISLLATAAQPPLNRWGMTTPEQFLTN
jgi:hypothetical protein